MNTDKLNYINVGLMFLAYLLAQAMPVELLVFSYAVVGPLHYLTEIPWLHKRNYFAAPRNEAWLLWLLAALSVVPALMSICTMTAVGFALCLVLFQQRWRRLAILALLLPLVLLLNSQKDVAVLFGLYLTTIVHVFIFTWLFVFSGCLKDKRISGFIALVTLTLLAVSFFVNPAPATHYVSSAQFVDNAIVGFGNLQKRLCAMVGWTFDWNGYVAITRFIAFAYTYHYLNWFSKTKVIRWHELRPAALVTVCLIYMASLTIYAINYKAGNQLLLLLSIGHVFLEFPLNWKTAGLIMKELRSITAKNCTLNPSLEV